MKNRLYLDMHALQALPASCVNRDDTNTPKTFRYGGSVRSEVSSQCWKKATRDYFKEHELESVGIRTRRLEQYVIEQLKTVHGFSAEDAQKYFDACAMAVGIKKKPEDDSKKKKKTGAKAETVETSEEVTTTTAETSDDSKKQEDKSVLAFYSETQIANFIKYIAENKENVLSLSEKQRKDALLQILKANASADILLFGRMFADNPLLDSDASCAVAHAFSVNEISIEYDYFTAVDDLLTAENKGAGHIGDKAFTAPILYRYASVNLSDTSELVIQDRKDAAKIARDFVEAFILSMPTGSINAYANYTVPDYILLTLRGDRPMAFSPAFIKPVNGGDYMEEAQEKLTSYEKSLSKNYGAPILKLTFDDCSFGEMLTSLEKEIEKRLRDGNTVAEI